VKFLSSIALVVALAILDWPNSFVALIREASAEATIEAASAPALRTGFDL